MPGQVLSFIRSNVAEEQNRFLTFPDAQTLPASADMSVYSEQNY